MEAASCGRKSKAQETSVLVHTLLLTCSMIFSPSLEVSFSIYKIKWLDLITKNTPPHLSCEELFAGPDSATLRTTYSYGHFMHEDLQLPLVQWGCPYLRDAGEFSVTQMLEHLPLFHYSHFNVAKESTTSAEACRAFGRGFSVNRRPFISSGQGFWRFRSSFFFSATQLSSVGDHIIYHPN